MPKSQDRPSPKWFSKAEICSFQGIAEQTFERTYRPLVPSGGVKKVGARVWFDGPAYFAVVMEHRLSQVKPSGASDDPMLEGGDSPALEEYRKHRARTAKVEADEREKLVVKVSEIEASLSLVFSTIRQGCEMVERQSGRDVIMPVVQALEEAGSAVEKLLSGDGKSRTQSDATPAGGGDAPASSDDEGIR